MSYKSSRDPSVGAPPTASARLQSVATQIRLGATSAASLRDAVVDLVVPLPVPQVGTISPQSS
jgi:hypothetical protein